MDTGRTQYEGTIRSLYPLSSGRFEDRLVRGVSEQFDFTRREELDLHNGKTRILKVTQVPNWDPSISLKQVGVCPMCTHRCPRDLVHRRCTALLCRVDPYYGLMKFPWTLEFDICVFLPLKRGVARNSYIRGGGEMDAHGNSDGQANW